MADRKHKMGVSSVAPERIPYLVLEESPKTTKTVGSHHPYEKELAAFEFTIDQILPLSNMPPLKTLEETPLILIEDRIGLENLAEVLRNEKEFAVDVEYSDQGFKAFVCLVQISTNTTDYIIDTLKVTKNDMKLLLNEVFVNPEIVKILHASSNDLKWLQQHFDLYLINLFDTQHALLTLGHCQVGLQAQLEKYNVFTDKRLQRADFRQRPLSAKLTNYARTDTHYLINIYYELRKELFNKTMLQVFNRNCLNFCKVVYEKDEQQLSYLRFEQFLKKHCSHKVLALQQLNTWRYRIAENKDINPGKVLSIKALKNLINDLPSHPDQVKKIGCSRFIAGFVGEILAVLSTARNGSKERLPSMKRNREMGPNRCHSSRANKKLRKESHNFCGDSVHSNYNFSFNKK